MTWNKRVYTNEAPHADNQKSDNTKRMVEKRKNERTNEFQFIK